MELRTNRQAIYIEFKIFLLIGCMFLKIGESIDLEYRSSSSVVKPHVPPNFINLF